MWAIWVFWDIFFNVLLIYSFYVYFFGIFIFEALFKCFLGLFCTIGFSGVSILVIYFLNEPIFNSQHKLKHTKLSHAEPFSMESKPCFVERKLMWKVRSDPPRLHFSICSWRKAKLPATTCRQNDLSSYSYAKWSKMPQALC